MSWVKTDPAGAWWNYVTSRAFGKALHKAGGSGQIIAFHTTREWFAAVGYKLKLQVFKIKPLGLNITAGVWRER
jgi:hypothetical protein